MTRLTNGAETIAVYMGNWDDNSGWGPDITGDLLGAAYEGYDDDKDAIIIDGAMQDFIDWAGDWERGEDEWTVEALNEAKIDANEELINHITNEINKRGFRWETV